MLARRTFLAGGAALATAAAARPALGQQLQQFGDAPLTGTVELAVVGPFTGDQIKLGEQMGNGVRQAIDDANQLRGPLDKAYTLRTFDDENLLATGLQAAEFACDDAGAVAVIGHLSGRITEQALHTYIDNKMIVICPGSSYDRLTAHGYGNILRLMTKDSTEGHLAAAYFVKTLKPSSVVILVQDGDYGSDVASGAAEELQGDKIHTSLVAFSWNKPDFDTVAAQTLKLNPDVVFCAGTTKDMGPVLPKLRAAGYKGPFYASQGFFEATTAQSYGADAEGLVVSTSMPPLALAPGAFRVVNDYGQQYGAMTPLAAFSYAGAQIVMAIVRRLSANDRIAVLNGLNEASVFDTVVGDISFSNTGDQVNPNVYFYSVTNGNWKYVTSAVPTSFVVK